MSDAVSVTSVTYVVMAKLPRPGRVKTRLVAGGLFDDRGAAEFAWALLECTVARLGERGPVVLAIGTDDDPGTEVPDVIRAEVGDRLGRSDLEFLPQGEGDLGQRLARIWRRIDGPVAFFGTDSPDVPASALASIPDALTERALAVGPTADGGYWTLAARAYAPEVLAEIDWGSDCVYDQTLRRARDAGLGLTSLPTWSDIDHPRDVLALRRRLARTDVGEGAGREAALVLLATRLDALMDEPSPGVDRAPLMHEEDALTTLPDGIEASELPQLDDATILLVDDNAQNLELIQAYLEALPCRLMTARDGVEAVQLIEQESPDLVLLDVMMPRMSGFEVCQKIKAAPRTRDIMVIMVTALHEVGDFERAVECGTDDFLTKPVNKLESLTRVKSLLRVRLLKRRLDELLAMRQRSGGGEDTP